VASEGGSVKLLLQYLAVGSAGFVGAITRVAVATLFGRLNIQFPLGTLFINVSGSLFLGWFFTLTTGRYPVSDTTRLAIGAGFVGAYTTFSTFMVESNALAEKGAGLEAILNLLLSLLLGLLAVRLGILIAHWRW
jgi:CrcB protein